MATVEITADNFESTVDKEGIVVLDFWAAWCGPCRTFGPIFEKASERHPDVTWGKIDTQAQKSLAAAMDIKSIPTVMVFRDGIPVFGQPGMLPAAALDMILEKVKELDMAEVRLKVEEAKKEHEAKAGEAS
jgi:thioredoxin 1